MPIIGIFNFRNHIKTFLVFLLLYSDNIKKIDKYLKHCTKDHFELQKHPCNVQIAFAYPAQNNKKEHLAKKAIFSLIKFSF